ncbi:MAG: T9SS type A sorting domain-containing protein [Phycisphaerae bacterium]|nr:T9SS type A sorting domain-containing protein [Saprospiraceae bacterium]
MKTSACTLGLFLAFHVAFAQIAPQQGSDSSNEALPSDNVKFLNGNYFPPPDTRDKNPYQSVEFQANCNVFSTLVCGQTYTNQAINAAAGNDFTISDYNCVSGAAFSGYDRLYKVTVSQKSSVHFIMDILNAADFDMFLLTSCSPPNCYAFSIEDNVQIGVYREVLDVNLNPGTYYLVIDAYDNTQQGTFNLTMNCSCTCVESTNDEPSGHKIFCDGFEDYLSNKPLTPQGTRWLLWDRCTNANAGCNSALSDDANVITDNGNKVIRVQQNNAIDPDLVYLLDNQTSSRWRLSWKMKLATNKGGYYNLLHTTPDADGGNANWACEVFFDSGGGGNLEVANSTIATFDYPVNTWFTVVNIVDLVKDSAQLWIDGEFVRQWKFSLGLLQNGTPSNLKRLAGANFYGQTNTDFYIDDICFWGQIPSCTSPALYDPVCIENGSLLTNESHARCQLYTSEEWGICNTVCDYGGTFIYRGEAYNGSLDLSDQAPSQILEAPCVKSAYGGNVPNNLAADIYIYHQDPNDVSGNQIDLNFDNNNDPLTKCFVFVCSRQSANFNGDQNQNICLSGQYCWVSPDIGNGYNDLPLNSCSNFYYLVVTGLPGATYSNLSVTPNGKCPSNPVPILCGENKTGTVSASQSDPYFSVSGNPPGTSAYKQCYSGTRAYNGGEQYYKFTLTQQTTVKLTMASNSQMGIFLYAFVCGSSCIAYAENTTINTQAIINQSLPEGSYYVIIDKNGGASNDFSLLLTCNVQNNFQINNVLYDGIVCPTNPTQVHQVAIPRTAYNFDNNDLINFLYRDNSGLLTSSDSLNKYWPGLPITYFNIKGDASADTLKCSYAPNDSFFVVILQTELGKDTYQKMIPTFSPQVPGVTGGAVFKPDSISLITRLRPVGQAATFSASTGLVRVAPNVATAKFVFSSSLDWTVEEQPAASWLTVTPALSDGAEEITLSFQQPYNLNVPRSTTLYFRSDKNPDLYRRFVKIEQLGICITPVVGISPTAPISVCAGQPISLTTTTGSQPEELFEFQWSTGETSKSISLPTTQSGVFSYSVTVTNKDCFTTASATKSVTINALPAAPTNPQNRTICAGATVPSLSVSTPAGITVDWYNQATGGLNVLSGNSNYTPPSITMTYYTEARNTTTGCVSSSRTPVMLTVNPIPTIQIADTVCTNNNLNYNVTLTTTNGATVTTTAGLVSGGNGNFNIVNVPADMDINITATFTNTGCSKTITLPAPSCGCPPVVTPTATNALVKICQGTPIPTLSVTVGANLTSDWYDANGTLLLAGSTSYTPTAAGDYFVKARNLVSGCVSTLSTQITLAINPLPTLTSSGPLCAPDLNSYSLTLNTTGNSVQSSAGTVTGSGTVTISGIPTGTNIVVTSIITSTGCQQQQTFISPPCPCPGVSAPMASGLITYCQGTPIPPLSVSVAAGETADWYAQASGGQPLAGGQGTTIFQASQAGTYYAAARNLVNNCISLTRTLVILEENPKPLFNSVTDTCEPSLVFYKVIVSTDANSVTAFPYTVENNGGGIFTVVGIPTGTAVNIKATTTATGCFTQESVLKSFCYCPSLAAPVSSGDKTICEGDNIPFLTVQVNPGETADWFDTGNALLLAGDVNFQPPGPGIYKARTRHLASGCPSTLETAVQLIVNPQATASAGKDTIICANGFALLQGGMSGASGVTWTASIPGGQFGNVNALATTYTPAVGINTVLLTLTTNDPSGPCPAASDQMLLNINPLPGIQILDTTCAPDLSTYTIRFVSANTQISILPNVGVLLFLGNGQYQLEDVPSGTNLTITATSTLTGCSKVLAVPAPQCLCGFIQAPMSLGNESACPGISSLPPLKVNPGPGNTTDWYPTATGGSVLPNGTGVNSFTPPGPGTFYAQARNLLTNCNSNNRTALTFSYFQTPLANAGPNQLVCPGEGLTLTVASNPGDTFKWSTGETTKTISVNPALPPGYSVTVTNSNQCTAADTVFVNYRPVPTVSIVEMLPILCHGGATGALFAGAQGGSGSGYSVVWSNGQTIAQILNLPAGVYSATLTDGAGCKDTALYTLVEPPVLAIINSTIMHVPTPTSNSGTISVSVEGGTPPYSYQWIQNGFILPGNNQPVITDQFAGTYFVEVKDANNCKITSDSLLILVLGASEPDWSSFIRIHPNPTAGIIYIDFNLPEFVNTDIMVYDAIGRLIKKTTPERLQARILQVDISDNPQGIYLLRIHMDNAQSVTKTVILNK